MDNDRRQLPDATARLASQVRAFLDALPGSDRGVVVAVSGGADSVALLRLLLAAVVGPVVVAHLNHGLRGAESDADESFVGGLVCDHPGLRLRTHRLDVAAAARTAGDNLEAVARRLRYDWLAAVARAEGL